MSTKSVAEKLAFKPNMSIWLSHAARQSLIEPLPEGVQTVAKMEEAAVALVFADNAHALRTLLDAQRDHLAWPSILWVAYPKANRVDINRDSLWPILVEYGMRPVGQVAVDAVWSALRFRPLQEGEAPFTGGR